MWLIAIYLYLTYLNVSEKKYMFYNMSSTVIFLKYKTEKFPANFMVYVRHALDMRAFLYLDDYFGEKKVKWKPNGETIK